MLDQLISEIPLVFLDTETTGLNPRYGDRMVEIALARFRGDVMEDYYVTLLNPGRPMSPGAARIHGITDDDVREAPRFADIIPPLRAALADVVIVAHNAPFDLGFVSNEFRLAHQDGPDNLVLDTLTLLRRHFQFPSNSLRRVAERLGIATNPIHRALGDVLTTRAVFDFIANDLARRGARTLADFLKLQGGTIPWRDEPEMDLPLPPALEEALRLNRKILLRYVDNFGEQTERWVSPIRVSAARDYLYLRAYCHLRNGERSFRLDRVLEMQVEE
jgi:DNA polymerase III epsilon subunit family exonuclease